MLLALMEPTVRAKPFGPPEEDGVERQASVASLPAATTICIPAAEASWRTNARESIWLFEDRDRDIMEPTKVGSFMRDLWF